MDILKRLGAISRQETIRYWSVSNGGWQNLVTSASALSSRDAASTRADFQPAELTPGSDHYFVQTDNRSSGKTVFQLHVQAVSDERVVVEIENVSPIETYFLTVFGAHDLRSAIIMQRQTSVGWGYYSLTSADGGLMAKLATSSTASFVNRAVALYRYAAGLPTDAAPPAMR